jgi:flagellar basal-body rod modification protein FlgD
MNIQSPVPAAASAAQTGTSTSTSSISGDPTGTFLQILVTELKSQDPTSPLDPNQMTQQIVSMNQLDQLISIHQILQGFSAPPSSKK